MRIPSSATFLSLLALTSLVPLVGCSESGGPVHDVSDAVESDNTAQDVSRVGLGRDADGPETSPPDTGPPDSGPPDSGPPDIGPPDSGPPDIGPPDTGPPGPVALTMGQLWDLNQQALADCGAKGADLDSDGLADACGGIEALIGTDPNHDDSDRDGYPDGYELFGDGSFDRDAPPPDRDGDGIIAPLDDDDDGDWVNDGASLDSDQDGVPNYLEFYGYVYDWKTGTFRAWDGDPTVAYAKSDPMQPSTDEDPYSDATEVSGLRMDPSVAAPGDHPMVPAYPQILVSLEEVEITLNGTVTMSDATSHANGTSWTSSMSATATRSKTTQWEVGMEASVSAGLGGFGASVSVSASYGQSNTKTYAQGTSVSEGGDVVETTEWSRAVSSNPAEAARIKLKLKIRNIGTGVASDVRPTLALLIGDRNVATFVPGGPAVNLLAPGDIYPAQDGVYWVVDSTATGGGQPLTLTMDDLRSLESGAPVTVEVTQLDARVYSKESGGAWVDEGDWGQYMARAEAVSAHLFLDAGDGKLIDRLVYADDGPSSPEVTLRDALVWGAGAYDDAAGQLVIEVPGLDGSLEAKAVDGWLFNFDQATYARVAARLHESGFNLLDTVLGPDSVVIAKAPPTAPTPDFHWASFRADGANLRVDTYVSDYFYPAEKLEVVFVDNAGQERPLAYDPALGIFSLHLEADYERGPEDHLVARNPFHSISEFPGDWEATRGLPGFVEVIASANGVLFTEKQVYDLVTGEFTAVKHDGGYGGAPRGFDNQDVPWESFHIYMSVWWDSLDGDDERLGFSNSVGACQLGYEGSGYPWASSATGPPKIDFDTLVRPQLERCDPASASSWTFTGTGPRSGQPVWALTFPSPDGSETYVAKLVVRSFVDPWPDDAYYRFDYVVYGPEKVSGPKP